MFIFYLISCGRFSKARVFESQLHSSLPNITSACACGNQRVRDVEEVCKVDMDAWYVIEESV